MTKTTDTTAFTDALGNLLSVRRTADARADYAYALGALEGFIRINSTQRQLDQLARALNYLAQCEIERSEKLAAALKAQVEDTTSESV